MIILIVPILISKCSLSRNREYIAITTGQNIALEMLKIPFLKNFPLD